MDDAGDADDGDVAAGVGMADSFLREVIVEEEGVATVFGDLSVRCSIRDAVFAKGSGDLLDIEDMSKGCGASLNCST